MTSSTSGRGALHRRGFVQGAAALALPLAGALGTAGRAGAAEGDPLHVAIARKARAVAAAAGDPAPLRLLSPEGSGANLKPVITAFLDMSGVVVDIKEVPVDEINSELTLDVLSGEADYDLALPATFGLPDLVESGAIRPLTAYARQYEPPGFRDGIIYSIGDTFDDEIYGFQTDGDAYLMFYHKDWLADPDEQARYGDLHGQALDIPTTWAELDRQMVYFHRPDADRFGGALFRTPGYLAWEWWARFHAKGVWPLSADLDPQIASDEGVAAVEEMIRASQSLYPQAQSAGLFDNWKLYGRGNVYANIGWGGSQKYLNGPDSAMRGRMRFGPTPGGVLNGKHVAMSYFNWGWNYVVTRSSIQPELAYLFALFASTPEISTRAVREPEGYFDPFRPEHYDDAAIIRAYSAEFLEVHERSMQGAIPDLYLANQSEYFRILGEWLDAAINQGFDPKVALTRAATQWSLLNLRVGKQSQRLRWNTLRLKYPAHVRAGLRDLS